MTLAYNQSGPLKSSQWQTKNAKLKGEVRSVNVTLMLTICSIFPCYPAGRVLSAPPNWLYPAQITWLVGVTWHYHVTGKCSFLAALFSWSRDVSQLPLPLKGELRTGPDMCDVVGKLAARNLATVCTCTVTCTHVMVTRSAFLKMQQSLRVL